MEALLGGDDSAFATLMQRWEVPVKAFIARLGVPSADVEDVAQEAFVRLYVKRANFRLGAAFKPWLLTIAGNLARNRLRWRFRHPAESWEGLVEVANGLEPRRAGGLGWAADQPAPASPSDDERIAVEVRRAVAALPPPLRAAVVCVELEDMSHAEAAQVLACSTKAVETRLYRAREALRGLLRTFLTETKEG